MSLKVFVHQFMYAHLPTLGKRIGVKPTSIFFSFTINSLYFILLNFNTKHPEKKSKKYEFVSSWN